MLPTVWGEAPRTLLGYTLVASLALNAYFISSDVMSRLVVHLPNGFSFLHMRSLPYDAFMAARATYCFKEKKDENNLTWSACTCANVPLGPMTNEAISTYYPYENASLASVWDTNAFLHGKLIDLSKFKTKVAMVINTASN